jgi:hypothetical protein
VTQGLSARHLGAFDPSVSGAAARVTLRRVPPLLSWVRGSSEGAVLIHSTRPVFVDVSGRRRRLVTVTGAVVGVGLATAIAVLVASMVVGASPLPLPGLPAGGQAVHNPGPEAEPPAPPTTSSDPSDRDPTRPPTTTAPAPGGPVAPPAVTTGPTTTPTTTRGNRPTEHPGNPRPSRSR